jgi:uncharacterized protein (DUF1810 family)
MTVAFDLQRFVEAQEGVYEQAVGELRAGRKRTHWMWFVFPQLAALGRSDMARFYGLSSAMEARAYLAHPVLGPRLLAGVEATLTAPAASAAALFGSPDDLKYRSCLTVFDAAAPEETLFARALARYYAGERDPLTLELLEGGSIGGGSP